MKTQWHNSWSV